MSILALADTPVLSDPFPHLDIHPALSSTDFDAIRAALPPPEGFLAKGGRKLELDIAEGAPAFDALRPDQQNRLLTLRELLRRSAPTIAARFARPLWDKYVWLLGEALATRVLAEGWTTTDGRVMGRSAGYVLRPHLDSAHFGVTCLLYLSEAVTAEDGALGLYRPDRQPEVLDASTYYPDRAEGIASTLVRSIPVRPNLFVAFVCSPVSLHGFGRTDEASGWRFVYQCHVLPRNFQIDRIASELDEAHRARWAPYVAAPAM